MVLSWYRCRRLEGIPGCQQRGIRTGINQKMDSPAEMTFIHPLFAHSGERCIVESIKSISYHDFLTKNLPKIGLKTQGFPSSTSVNLVEMQHSRGVLSAILADF